jgi:hypothetical protein
VITEVILFMGAVLREDGGEVVEETKVAQYCARVLLGVASKIAEVGATEAVNTRPAVHGCARHTRTTHIRRCGTQHTISLNCFNSDVPSLT